MWLRNLVRKGGAWAYTRRGTGPSGVLSQTATRPGTGPHPLLSLLREKFPAGARGTSCAHPGHFQAETCMKRARTTVPPFLGCRRNPRWVLTKMADLTVDVRPGRLRPAVQRVRTGGAGRVPGALLLQRPGVRPLRQDGAQSTCAERRTPNVRRDRRVRNARLETRTKESAACACGEPYREKGRVGPSLGRAWGERRSGPPHRESKRRRDARPPRETGLMPQPCRGQRSCSLCFGQ